MLRCLRELKGYSIIATDGVLGKVDDFYFDDHQWTIRYLVADTGRWLPGRLVLISPASLREPQWVSESFPVNLTKEQVRSSPSIDTDRPVSRQQELEVIRHYGWPMYPIATGHMVGPMGPGLPVVGEAGKKEEPPGGDPHLRSFREIKGYRIHATDGEIGHVEDLIVDDDGWKIRSLAVDTKNWWPGKKVLVPPEWAESISVEPHRGTLYLNVSRDIVRNSPEYDPSAPVNVQHEERAYDFYGRPKF